MSDRELNIASWIYNHRLSLRDAILFLLSACLAVLVILLIINASVFLIKNDPHQIRMDRTTAGLVLGVDPSLDFLPEDIEVQEILSIIQPRGGIDFLAKVINHNQDWFAFSFDYNFIVDGEPLPGKTGFVMPGESVGLVGFLPAVSYFQKVNIKLDNLRWFKARAQITKERLSLLWFDVLTAEFKPGDNSSVVDSVDIDIQNQTPFGFWKVKILALAYDGSGQLVAIGEGNIEHFLYQQERSINIGLGYLGLGEEETVTVEIIPQVNILDETNILYL